MLIMDNNERIDKFYINFKNRDYLDTDLNSKKRGILDCSLGVNPFETKKIKILNFYNKYPDMNYNKIKEVIFSKWKKENNLLKKQNISFGNGSAGVLRNIFQFLLEEDDIVLGYSPQFPRAITEIELRKAKYNYYELNEEDNYKFCVEKFIQKIDFRQKAIYIDNPNNPTGQVIDLKDIEKIVKIASTYNIYVIIDEAYGDYVEDCNSSINLVGQYENLIVIRSASKFYGMPEYRIGYIISNEKFIELYNKLSLPFPFPDTVSSLLVKRYNDTKKNESYRRKTCLIKQKIIENINRENLLYTDKCTPILTIKSNKYDDLNMELLKNGICAESCIEYINLNNKFARIRINKDYKKIIKILNEIL